MHFLIGLAVGIIVSAPVGPVNLMAVQRAFRDGFIAGLATGIGAVLADLLFASVAAFGVAAVADFLIAHRPLIQAVGGSLLLVFGWMTLRTHPRLDPSRSEASSAGVAGGFAAFAMTLTNPGAVLGFAAIFSALGDLAPAGGDYAGALAMVAGVAVGASLWWAAVAGAVSLLRERMTDLWLERINQGAGGLLLLAGVAILVRGSIGLLG